MVYLQISHGFSTLPACALGQPGRCWSGGAATPGRAGRCIARPSGWSYFDWAMLDSSVSLSEGNFEVSSSKRQETNQGGHMQNMYAYSGNTTKHTYLKNKWNNMVLTKNNKRNPLIEANSWQWCKLYPEYCIEIIQGM